MDVYLGIRNIIDKKGLLWGRKLKGVWAIVLG